MKKSLSISPAKQREINKEKVKVRRDLAKEILTALIREKQWSHDALVRNAVELTDLLLEALEEKV